MLQLGERKSHGYGGIRNVTYCDFMAYSLQRGNILFSFLAEVIYGKNKQNV